MPREDAGDAVGIGGDPATGTVVVVAPDMTSCFSPEGLVRWQEQIGGSGNPTVRGDHVVVPAGTGGRPLGDGREDRTLYVLRAGGATVDPFAIDARVRVVDAAVTAVVEDRDRVAVALLDPLRGWFTSTESWGAENALREAQRQREGRKAPPPAPPRRRGPLTRRSSPGPVGVGSPRGRRHRPPPPHPHRHRAQRGVGPRRDARVVRALLGPRSPRARRPPLDRPRGPLRPRGDGDDGAPARGRPHARRDAVPRHLGEGPVGARRDDRRRPRRGLGRAVSGVRRARRARGRRGDGPLRGLLPGPRPARRGVVLRGERRHAPPPRPDARARPSAGSSCSSCSRPRRAALRWASPA